MDTRLSDVILHTARESLKLSPHPPHESSKNKALQPCNRIWAPKYHSEVLGKMLAELQEKCGKTWEEEGMEMPGAEHKVAIDFFSFLNPLGIVEGNGDAVAGKDKKDLGWLKKLLPVKAKKERANLKLRMTRDGFEGKLSKGSCPPVHLGSLMYLDTNLPVSVMPLAEKANADDLKEHRKVLVYHLQKIEIVALLCSKLYVPVAKISCTLLLQSHNESAKASQEYMDDLVAWIADEQGKAPQLFPLLHEMAKGERFVVVSVGPQIKDEGKIEDAAADEAVAEDQELEKEDVFEHGKSIPEVLVEKTESLRKEEFPKKADNKVQEKIASGFSLAGRKFWSSKKQALVDNAAAKSS